MFENIRLAFQGIWAHKMRSFLTMLGIIIGIAAIIAIVSTIKGTNDQIKENIVGKGNALVQINLSQGDWMVSPSDGMDLSMVPVITEDMKNDIRNFDSISDVSSYHLANIYGEIYYKDNSLEGVQLIGSDNKYIELNDYVICKGRNFLEDDYKKFRNVVILDRTAEYSLFEGEDSINQTIEIKGIPFVVVGVVDKDSSTDIKINTIEEYYTYYSNDTTGKIIIPEAVWPNLYTFDEPSQVVVEAVTKEAMTQAGKDAEDYLNGLFDSKNDEGIKYKREDTLQIAKELQDISNTTNQQLIWIASISLIVGGIGVMNIMLVSVTERTREIGLKKALGARRGVILGQFLTEAAVLTSLGGIVGVGVGIGLAYLISKAALIPVAISIPAIIVSVVFSMVIGIVFGLIPSIKAAKLNPIDALRYE